MGDELDYMSEEFVRNCEDSRSDVRPGLLKTHREQRQHNLIKKQKLNSEITKGPSDVEVLQESLKQPINATNKGFSMLEKMGFKSGMGLGKNNSGIKEPIGINIKNDKGGLGHKSTGQKKPQKKCENKLDQMDMEDFRAFQSKKKREQMTLSDFKKSQRICKEFDLKVDRDIPKEPWFWPEEESEELSEEENDGDDDGVELSNAEKLEMLTKYLRKNYFYCIWCKIQYNDENDLSDCPGSTRDDH